MHAVEQLKKKFQQAVEKLQEQITQQLQTLDPDLVVTEDLWQRSDFAQQPGGGGRTRAVQGAIFESGGVNTSTIWGAIDPQLAQKLKGQSQELWACGISFILHPLSPKIPSVHGNFRMIENPPALWFGGGVDLTPYYPHLEDFQYFHQVWRTALTPYGVYPEMKRNCDQYFVNHHRGGEMRGIGGFFFDHYHSPDLAQDLEMVLDFSQQFIPSYFPLVEKRLGEDYSQQDVEFQHYRRGRYVEFNLLHDRGTLFGLQTNGRVESILISLPPRCRWGYRYTPAPGPQQEMMRYYFPHPWGE